MKKTTTAALSLLLCTAMLSSCGAGAGTAPQDTQAAASSETAADTTSQAVETESSAADDTTAAEETTAEAKDSTAPDTKSMTALEFANVLGNGIDLGNTHEAYGHGSYSWDTDPKVFEKLWGQPNTSQEIISGMKAAGFDTVRVPVAWTNGMDYESGDYTINPALLDRIGEVIDYAINADMYVIVNDHWDGSWWGMFGSATEETRQKAMDMYISMWTQIGERYKDYPDNLIFESANEELGDRLNDKDVAEDSGTLSAAECFETTNLINQTFVDTIRAQGSNNADRFLLIAGYNTDIEHTTDPKFKMPTDTAKDKLLVSVHYYNPSTYCLFGSVNHWGKADQYKEMNKLLESLTKFTDEGYGVIIGEYGVLTEGSEPREDWDLWFDNFINNCDLYGYVPVLWDCNGLYNKLTYKISNADVAKFFEERSNASRAAAGLSDEDIKNNARKGLDEALKAAEDRAAEEMEEAPDENTAMAWIMYQSADWSVSYSVGDVFDPTAKTDGIKATNPVITGPGEYTVALDLTDAGLPKGCVFSAVGVTNGEILYPDCIIDIKSVKINGEEIKLEGTPYTSSDDGKCTRVNLYNMWVSKVPAEARSAEKADDLSPQSMVLSDKQMIKTIEVTFDFIV
ncbi:MAG: glycoside hydrolase family 5 protein [Oscillospiraceae bacterium]|nr:glycoside hydrolase family 5 protein [Oscillospiraceae bacterium]